MTWTEGESSLTVVGVVEVVFVLFRDPVRGLVHGSLLVDSLPNVGVGGTLKTTVPNGRHWLEACLNLFQVFFLHPRLFRTIRQPQSSPHHWQNQFSPSRLSS